MTGKGINLSKEYDQYLREHQGNVIKGYMWIKDNLDHYSDLLSDDSFIYHHDESKWDEDEYAAYDDFFFGSNDNECRHDFQKAWNTHVHCNPHHWEHWTNIDKATRDENGFSVTLTAIEMPFRYVIEMICDWWAFSWKKNDLFEIFDWYEEHKNEIILGSATRQVVESILSEMKVKLESLEGHQWLVGKIKKL